MLLCTVRDCRRALVREGRRFVCAQGHSFDIAGSGYVNLLQPQDRRSRAPGDSAAAVQARRRIHDRGLTTALRDGLAAMLCLQPGDRFLDVGCGEGFYTGSLALQFQAEGWGVDLSVPAVQAAAKRYPACHWQVANADRFLPYESAAFAAVVSITARLHPEEFLRVLRPEGRLLLAVPAPDDLIELRGAFPGAGDDELRPGRDRTVRVLALLEPHFRLLEQRRISCNQHFDADAVSDVLVSIYRPMRTTPPQPMRLTFSLDALLLEPR